MRCALTEQKQPSLWRYNATTGLWALARVCTTATQLQWLEIYRKDEPGVAFKLAARKPKGKPKQ